MKKYRTFFLLPLLLLLLCNTSCVDEEQYADDPQGNFEALWKIMDQHYCFFSAKNINWDEIHTKYAKEIDADMTQAQLFEVLGNMLSELKDGHVNLYSSYDVARNWSWHENYPSNYSDTLIDKYLGTKYNIGGSLKYRILDDNIGYVRCSTFENKIGSGNLDDMLLFLATCNGLIIDVRDNSGGLISSAETLAARFTNKETLVGYMRHKTGTEHDDLSDYSPQTLKPSNGVRWQKRVIVLTNRSVYSAANEFVKYMRCCPNVTICGDRTGGGAGMPFNSELPNGWTVRFSACPLYDKDKQLTEFGIAPDDTVSLSTSDFYKGYDTIIEYARKKLAK